MKRQAVPSASRCNFLRIRTTRTAAYSTPRNKLPRHSLEYRHTPIVPTCRNACSSPIPVKNDVPVQLNEAHENDSKHVRFDCGHPPGPRIVRLRQQGLRRRESRRWLGNKNQRLPSPQPRIDRQFPVPGGPVALPVGSRLQHQASQPIRWFRIENQRPAERFRIQNEQAVRRFRIEIRVTQRGNHSTGFRHSGQPARRDSIAFIAEFPGSHPTITHSGGNRAIAPLDHRRRNRRTI